MIKIFRDPIHKLYGFVEARIILFKELRAELFVDEGREKGHLLHAIPCENCFGD